MNKFICFLVLFTLLGCNSATSIKYGKKDVIWYEGKMWKIIDVRPPLTEQERLKCSSNFTIDKYVVTLNEAGGGEVKTVYMVMDNLKVDSND